MKTISITDQRRDDVRVLARQCALLYAHCVLAEKRLAWLLSGVGSARYKELVHSAEVTRHRAETALDQFYTKHFYKKRLSAEFITKFEGAEREARTARTAPMLFFIRPYVLDLPQITEALPGNVDVKENRAEVVRLANEILAVKAAGETRIPKVSTEDIFSWWYR